MRRVVAIDCDAVAAFIFNRHSENFARSTAASRAVRVAFMMRGADGREHEAGGLGEPSLAAWIEDAIKAQLSSED